MCGLVFLCVVPSGAIPPLEFCVCKNACFFSMGWKRGKGLERVGRRGGGEEGGHSLWCPLFIFCFFAGCTATIFFIFASEALSSRPHHHHPTHHTTPHATPCPAAPCWRPRSPCWLCLRPPRRLVSGRGGGGGGATRGTCAVAAPPKPAYPPARRPTRAPRAEGDVWLLMEAAAGRWAAGGGGKAGAESACCGVPEGKRARRRLPRHHTHTHHRLHSRPAAEGQRPGGRESFWERGGREAAAARGARVFFSLPLGSHTLLPSCTHPSLPPPAPPPLVAPPPSVGPPPCPRAGCPKRSTSSTFSPR